MLFSSPTHLAGSLFLPRFCGAARHKYESNLWKKVRAARKFCYFYHIFGMFHWKLTWKCTIWGNFPYFVWIIFWSGAYFFPIFQECLFLPPPGGAVGQNIYLCPYFGFPSSWKYFLLWFQRRKPRHKIIFLTEIWPKSWRAFWEIFYIN